MKFSQRSRQVLLIALAAIGVLIPAILASVAGAEPTLVPRAYLPQVYKPLMPVVEVRGLWVTRFDWTDYGQPAQKGRIDQIVDDASRAGFNTILFQVRGIADAYYTPGPEPWAQRVSGIALGVAPNPYWDPLDYFVEKAHDKGIELHAYINIYPVWNPCNQAPPATTPRHFYYKLRDYHGVTAGKLNGLQWNTDANVLCSTYLRATPASIFADNHYLEVARYLADNYAIDGLHLDHIRYGSRSSSCDPVSAQQSGVPCFAQAPEDYANYQDWQRAQVNGTVRKFYDLISSKHPEMMLSAAVWPTYINYWGWKTYDGYPYSQGYYDYYQDSQAWIKDGYIDALMPMIY
ncbi:MAG TPA: family 10 glycosylhydrolase, partial [Anaerolineae bacterium]|nr:family 10 glycosylhydrolase [Anaerolineae bacterium]